MSGLLTYPSILVGSPCKGEVNRGPDDEETVGDFDGIQIGSKERRQKSAGMSVAQPLSLDIVLKESNRSPTYPSHLRLPSFKTRVTGPMRSF